MPNPTIDKLAAVNDMYMKNKYSWNTNFEFASNAGNQMTNFTPQKTLGIFGQRPRKNPEGKTCLKRDLLFKFLNKNRKYINNNKANLSPLETSLIFLPFTQPKITVRNNEINVVQNWKIMPRFFDRSVWNNLNNLYGFASRFVPAINSHVLYENASIIVPMISVVWPDIFTVVQPDN